MDILKYLDVLIGLTVVMILLSPLVSALTQLWVWLWNIRAKRLEVALRQLIVQLKVSPYDRFDAVRVSGLAPGAGVTLDGVPATADAHGNVVFRNGIPQLLKAGNGSLTFQPPQGLAAQKFLARGPVGDWEVTSPATDPAGVAKVKYAFSGPAQFASHSAETTLPAGVTLSAKIASGPLEGTPLVVAGPAAPGGPTTITYPPNTRPVPASHEVELTLTNAAGPVANVRITLRFARNESFDVQAPLPVPVPLTDETAGRIARAILLHPMVARPPFLRWRGLEWRMRGEVIEREELIRILLGFAANEGGAKGADAATRDNVKRLVGDNGVTDPARALADIRDASQRLEREKPGMAASTRLSAAILTAAPSDFVGTINNWFDQAMARTTAEYKFRTQIITVVAALIVALAVQMDSLDLLKKLATDDKLRNSLVDQAKEQQKRIDDLAKTSTKDAKGTKEIKDEIEAAKVRRQEIEANLTKLRDPSLAILPEHFIWQPVPTARLIRDSTWRRPEQRRLELVIGAGTYVIDPPRTYDPLVDISNAVVSSGAPVTPRIERPHAIVIRADALKVSDVDQIKLTVDGSDAVERPEQVAQATLVNRPKANEQLHLVVGYDRFQIKAGKDGEIRTAIEQAKSTVPGEAAARAAKDVVSVDAKGQVLTAWKPETRWMELMRPGDSTINLLSTPPKMVRRIAYIAASKLKGAKECALSIGGPPQPVLPCDVTNIISELRKRGVDAETRDQLVLVSRRNPPLQLRAISGQPESNLLDSKLTWECSGWRVPFLSDLTAKLAGAKAGEADVCFDWPMLRQSWLGLLVTWMLLSLGAPFWYDALKDLLKLRSTLAKKEETDRNERARTQP